MANEDDELSWFDKDIDDFEIPDPEAEEEEDLGKCYCTYYFLKMLWNSLTLPHF